MTDHEYRIKLEQKPEELRQSLRRRDRIAVERTAEDLDQTLLAAERESATHEMERTSRLLRQIDVAIARLRAGKHGLCVKCERDIPEKRLKAVPWALYCVECQETVDRLHARMDVLRKPAA